MRGAPTRRCLWGQTGRKFETICVWVSVCWQGNMGAGDAMQRARVPEGLQHRSVDSRLLHPASTLP